MRMGTRGRVCGQRMNGQSLILGAMVAIVLYTVAFNRTQSPAVPCPPVAAPRVSCPKCDSANSNSVSTAAEPTAGSASPLDRVKWPALSYDNPGTGLLEAIYRHQNPLDCNSARYLVWRFPLSDRDARNLGALYSTLQVWLAYAMQTNRVLVFDDRNWKLTDERCEHRSTTCYFRPVSACQPPLKPKGLVSLRKSKEVGKTPQTVQVIEFEGAWWPMSATKPFTVTIKRNGVDVPLEVVARPRKITQWSTAALQYMWRPNDVLEGKINAVLNKLALSRSVVPRRTIGMPVRASDKCIGHNIMHSAAGEMKCIPLDAYMRAAEAVRSRDPAVDTIIFTSESREMVEASRRYSDRWKFVYNTIDVLQGTGSTNTATLKKSKLRSKGIESAIISLHMQLRAKYFILPYDGKEGRVYSSWLLSIGNFAKSPTLTFVEETQVVDVLEYNKE